MAKRFVKVVNESEQVRFLPIGPWARRDFLTIGVRPDRMVDWGYFVAPSASPHSSRQTGSRPDGPKAFRLLWAGWFHDWKRTETAIRAVRLLGADSGVRLTVVGDGREKDRLLKLADGIPCSPCVFLPQQPMERMRKMMREHDLLVVTSDAGEGWGAVVSEALEEGLPVVGTLEAGASAALLPRERLFHAGDVKALARLIVQAARGELPPCSIGEWTAAKAAEHLLNFL